MELKNLFTPIKVGSMTMRNRLMTTSMSPGLGYVDPVTSRPTQRFYNYLEERARGGLGAICQSISFYPVKDDAHKVPEGFSEEHIPHLKKMAEAVQKHGCKIVGQALSVHEWRRSPDEPVDHWGPTPVKMLPSMPDFRPMSVEDIKIFTEQVVQCGRILQASGWDAIELVAGVGATLSRFMSKATNTRTDEYGGSIENRCRFTVEVIQALKKALPDFPVVVRWTPVDYVKGGNEMEEALQIAPLLEAAGADWHNLQIGWHESSVPVTTKEVPEGGFSWMAEKIKKIAKIPVAVGYRNTDPENMEKIIASGQADIIAGLRYSIADPEFGNKAREGRLADIARCICCCRCLDDVVSEGKPLEYCSVNPRLGPELDKPLEPAVKSKKVMVIGTGPGGLSAAMTAHRRGHAVTVYERGPRIGGCLVMSAIFSPLYERLTIYYKDQLKKTPQIKVHLNTTVTKEIVDSMKPDAVIVAIGGHPVDLKVPGVERGNVVRSHDFLELLNGRAPSKPGVVDKFMWNSAGVFLRLFYSPQLIKKMMFMPWPFGKNVAIIGGGLPGCELGVELLRNNRKLAIIEERKKIGYDVGGSERFHMTSKFKKSPDVQMEPNTKVISVTGEGVNAQRNDGTIFTYKADTVAVTLGFEKNMGLADSLEGGLPVLKVIGDCIEPKRMADATKKGYLAATEI